MSKKKSGYVAIIGKPNVGKSTLLNRLIGQKISITSKKPQTTRHRIIGIDTEKKTQIIYVDTPGMHGKQTKAINRLMNRAASSSTTDVDVVVLVIEGTLWEDNDQLALEHAKNVSCPVILFVNKADLVKDKTLLLPHIDSLSQSCQFLEIIPGSAKDGENVDVLQKKLRYLMPKGEWIYPEDYITDRSQRFLVSEIIREKLIRYLGDELPYATTVEIEAFKEDKGLIHINAIVLVERKVQKAIVIGKEGKKLKEIGRAARVDMEKFFDKKVFLELWVKVKSGWADDERMLQSLGYHDDFPM